MEKSWIIAVVLIGAFVSVESLQCYQCMDCPKDTLNDTLLVTCGASEVTTATPATNTTVTPPVDTNSTTNGTDPQVPGANDTDSDQPQALRGIQLDYETEPECTCYGLTCSCDEEVAVPRVIQYADATITYVCATVTAKQNNTEGIMRGCAASRIEEKEFCSWIEEAAGNSSDVQISQCTTCTTDKCNGAFTEKSSIITFLFVVATLFIAK